MEIITLDHQVYQDLVTRINRISDYVFKKAAVPAEEPEIWLTSEELAELLKISTRTLQRMRKERTIPYCMIRSKCLYRFSDVEKCIARRIVSCNPQTLDEFRESYRTTHESTSR
ncbi:helix-turn-helix domain-containing protein [Parabacteroides distasonis]|uniref:helix-turn-helix domain-containing protein n=1 Tax=Parabacteroides distasonis TaxID=823 RepID=UPI00280437C9|nr:helix-turn-helix domain-containing protein [Parabacteroides distasonis]WMI43236.1 helix-turn-helix domain-containing protein [Parabacteroides distasonis]